MYCKHPSVFCGRPVEVCGAIERQVPLLAVFLGLGWVEFDFHGINVYTLNKIVNWFVGPDDSFRHPISQTIGFLRWILIRSIEVMWCSRHSGKKLAICNR
jgi:hypothetical protein